MKTRAFLFVLFFFFLLLSGCSSLNSQSHIIAQMAVATSNYERPYTFYVVQTKGSSASTNGKTSYSGTFDLVVRGEKGAEASHESLNQYFGNKALTFEGPVKLAVQDCNADKLLDFPLGFSAGDGSGEDKYVIFSVGKNGKIFTLPAKGYKEDGFVYTAAGGNCSLEFTRTIGTGEGRSPGILVGVAKEGGNFAPAEYIWDGKQFVFEKENPFIIAQSELNTNGQKNSIKVIQTEYKKPLTSSDQGFSIAESMYRGRFDLLVQNGSGEVTSQLSLNQYFGNANLGFAGSFPLVFGDYNRDGNADFAIGQPDKNSPEFQYVLFSVNSKGNLSVLPAGGYKEEGFVYNAESGLGTGFPLLKNGETGFTVTLSGLGDTGYVQGKYVWNGNKFVFSKL
ncbi:hypothetical protein REC12_03140 [Desulfosporosinus sp. PR]|uniref:hypothetical protein n=1 Tax=Candidatus Desulfosporosinus nitrosoreducens TaxID=3401928 RepID=UPI0027F89067|nr:hypothetical protein [Desulfosporosinus sp. PR]MDQ7092580.1 hypothetical protein [Desulfosporosinus sp. PR]